MSTVSVIATIIVLLSVLVCYAFVAQTVKQKREQRNRLLAALKSRSRSFKFILNGFPEGFLPRELTLLVQRSLIELCEQLTRLEPKDTTHMQDLQSISALLAETQRHTKPASPVTLESPQQIKEVKICLEELHRFVLQLENKNGLSRNQADTYRNQIKQLALQLTVDGYALQGRLAQQGGKIKLAAHYYDLAVKLLIREGKAGKIEDRVAKLKAIHTALIEQLAKENEKEAAGEDEQIEQEEIADEWDKFGEDNSEWKKKNIYD
ncbi:hypothetical protein [Teredinibacter purpureus]|uniref:hypothetical protein n=1 Tax=Teredinibacter purpureus TaxID=2731756 RepID=UPI0005F851D0|nr:hypothetical protein [Teredinibacter purpureus]